jgi:hypothetical protein
VRAAAEIPTPRCILTFRAGMGRTRPRQVRRQRLLLLRAAFSSRPIRFLRVRSQCSHELCVARRMPFSLFSSLQPISRIFVLCCALFLSGCICKTEKKPARPICRHHVTRFRFLLVDRVAAELPHMSRAEIEEHEDWFDNAQRHMFCIKTPCFVLHFAFERVRLPSIFWISKCHCLCFAGTRSIWFF